MNEETVKEESPADVVPAEDVPKEESFAELLEKNGAISWKLSPGQKVRGKVVGISSEYIYIDLGGKSEGTIDVKECTNPDGTLSVNKDDEIDAFFVSVEEGIRRLTTLVKGYSASSIRAISSAFDAGMPVTGDVRREVNGGFEVSVGNVRCFCPISQIDIKGKREGTVYVGQPFSFRILKFERDSMNVILSRRVLLDQEKEDKLKKLRESLTEGQEVNASVCSIHHFGAFVDLGGVQGLIPASEISWGHIEDPKTVFSVGQEVTAKILSLNWEKKRLTLSLKALLPDPWLFVDEKYQPDTTIKGTIVRLAPFGVFVNIEPGVDGLVHISNLGAGRRVNHPKEVVQIGQPVDAYVLAVDSKNKRLSLSLQPKREPKKIPLPPVGELLDGIIDKVMPFGIFVKLPSGLSALIPNSEMGTPRGSDHGKMFPMGTSVKAIVLETDREQGKITLSRRGLIEREEQEDYKQFKATVRKEQKVSGGLGRLGELLKARIEEKKLTGEPADKAG